MKRNYLRLCCALSLALTLGAIPAFPQSQATGNITGRAQDASGALIPGVEVTIASPSMIGGARSAVTDETGTYRFTLLVSGTYRVSFALSGFKTLNIDGVDVTPNATRTINGTMEVASMAEEVTVTSQAPAIDLQAATVGVNWDMNKLDNLPSSRSLNALVSMIPGLFLTGTYDVGGSQFGTTSGVAARTYGRTGNNVVAVDGLVWCQGYADYGAFEEINVSTASKGADQANSGVTLNMTIKSGGNQFHGNFTSQYERGSFQSTNIDDNLRKRGLSAGSNKFTYLRNIYGDIGGPIMKDRLWFYFSYMSGYQGEFRPGYISVKNNAPAVFYTKLDNPTGKLTYQITSKQKFDASWQINRKWQPYRQAGKYTPLEATQNQDSWATYGPSGKWTYIISPKMTATAGINRGGYWWPDIPWSGAPINSVVSLPGIPTANDLNTVRRNDLTTNALVGPNVGIYRRPIRWTWNGDMAYFTPVGGKNSELKFGYTGWWTKNYTTNFGYPNQQIYRYRSLASEDYVNTTVASLVGLFQHPDSVQVIDYPNSASSAFGYKSFYIDEKLNWNRKLTLKVGIRYDRFTSWLPAQGRKGLGPKDYIPVEFATPFLYPAQPSSLFPVISKLVPRLSFAYDITGTGRLAFKASYGRYTAYSSSPGNPVNGASDVNPNAPTTCTYNGWRGDIPFRPVVGNYTSVSGCNTSLSTDVSKWPKKFAKELDASYLDEYTAGLDVGFSRNYSLRVNIVRKFDFPRTETISNNQPYAAYTQQLCYNYDASTNRVTATTLQPPTIGNPNAGVVCVWNVPRTNPNQGITDTTIVNRRKGEGKSQYTALEATFNKQLSDKWGFLGSYVIDMRHENPLDPENPNEAAYHCSLLTGDNNPTCYGPSTWDHAIKINGQYELPWGFEWASTFTGQTQNWINRGVQVRNGLNSNVTQMIAYNVTRLSWVKLWDNRLSKRFKIGDKQSVEATFDLFNSMNVNTVTNVGSTIGPASFKGLDGSLYRPSAIIAPRIFQIGARYKF